MIRILSLLLMSIALVGNVWAQQKPWQPFPLYQTGYYKSSDGFFFTLSADSFKTTGTDTIVYFNRKLFPNESLCTQPGSSLWKEYWPHYMATFVRDSFVLSNDTVWFSLNDFSNQPWIFNVDILQPIHDTFAWDDVWFDNAIGDLVRRVSRYNSNGVLLESDVMRISKYHGLVAWRLPQHSVTPVASGVFELQLVGFVTDSLAWGFQPPSLQRYFDYHPGDVIRWLESNGVFFPPSHTNTFIRDSVLSVTATSASVTLSTWRTTRSYNGDSLLSETQGPFTFNFEPQKYGQAALRTTSFLAYDPVVQFTYDITLREVETVDCGLDTVLELRYGGISMTDSCSYIEIPDQEWMWSFSTRRGYLSKLFDNSVIGAYAYFEQTGFYSPVNNIMCGNYAPLGVQGVESQQTLVLYPNPVSHTLRLQTPYIIAGHIELHDATGRVLERRANVLINNVYEIEAASLSPGLYVIRIVSTDAVHTAKFIKQ